MRHIRRAFPITIGLATAAACVLLACGDDDTAVTPTPDGSVPDSSKPDTSSPPIDSGGGTDTGTGTDTGVDTGVDAGPTVTNTPGSTGEISVQPDIVVADFYEDDTIVHWSNAPNCVAFARGTNKKSGPAGTLKVGGEVVGKDGGADMEIEVSYDPDMGYFFPATVFPPVDTYSVNVQTTQAVGFAPMPVEAFRPSREAPITLTAPAALDGGAFPTIPSTAPYTITWTAPTGGFVNDQVIIVSMVITGSSALTAKNLRLYCTFPLKDGTGTIPANVLSEIKTRGGGGASLDGLMHIYSGGAKEVKLSTGSYFVEVARTDSTSIGGDNGVVIQ
jgi:hypothetical protein